MNPGSPVTCAGGDETGGDPAAYRERWDRLCAVKHASDPDNIVRNTAHPKARP